MARNVGRAGPPVDGICHGRGHGDSIFLNGGLFYGLGAIGPAGDPADVPGVEGESEGNGMKEIGIIFSTPMVQAIRENRKSMTRRVIKPQPLWIGDPSIPFKTEDADLKGIIKCPYGQPGDRLWVRETWGFLRSWDCEGECNCSTAYKGDMGCYQYKATSEDLELKWKPSIHMPKVAARILLEVVSVRVERVQDITEEDAKAEGVGDLFIEDCAYDDKYNNIPWIQEEGLTIHQFARLWNSINEKRNYGWDNNPWVWVVEFRRSDQ